MKFNQARSSQCILWVMNIWASITAFGLLPNCGTQVLLHMSIVCYLRKLFDAYFPQEPLMCECVLNCPISKFWMKRRCCSISFSVPKCANFKMMACSCYLTVLLFKYNIWLLTRLYQLRTYMSIAKARFGPQQFKH